MLMKELKEKKCISSRLYNGLGFRFRNTPNNLKVYYAMLCEHNLFKTLSFDEKNEIEFAYIKKMNQKYANSSLEEVLLELNVSEPKDIMQFRGLGKKCIFELEDLIERGYNE